MDGQLLSHAASQFALGNLLCQFDPARCYPLSLAGQAVGDLLELLLDMANTSLKDILAQKLLSQQVLAEHREQTLVYLTQDVKTLLGWFSHDVLSLAGPSLAVRQELFDFIVSELQQREDELYPAIRKLRKALRNQRDQLLAFAGVLDQKLADIADGFKLPLQAVREVCLLHRKHETSDAYWIRWNQLHSKLSGKFHDVMQAVDDALKQTPRASSMVENLNSHLRNYFFLWRSLGDDYLNLLRFFLNHRQFMRSLKPERVGKSPKQLLTKEAHPHWLELLEFQRFQRA